MGAQQPPPNSEAPQWHVTLLGQVNVVAMRPGTQLSDSITRFRTTKVALLLARLALFPNRVHGREELAALLSPDAPDVVTGRVHLSHSLTFLRKILEPEGTPPSSVLIATPTTVRIMPGTISCDVVQFEEMLARATRSIPASLLLLRDACALYSGDFMPGFYLDWVNDERNRLEALWTAACSLLQQLQANLPAPVPAVVQLPSPITSFLGRKKELASILTRLRIGSGTRLLTLTGMGGIGKTRLATQAAHAVIREGIFTNVVFVPLSEIIHAGALPAAIAGAMGILDDAGDPAIAVQKHLHNYEVRAERSLLILDNLEQFHDDLAPLLQTLLRDAPQLSILATSQRPVGLRGEQEFPLFSLPGIASGTSSDFQDIDSLLQCTDVQLFVERARLVRPEFVITEDNGEAIVALCRFLEGIPLAIELAAARIRALSSKQIVGRLTKMFSILEGRNNLDNTRHYSLWATIAWSYDLLTPIQQSFFAALSVFRVGFSLEAVEAVTGVAEAFELLSSLCERSLVLAVIDNDTGEMRYRLLEPLRTFGDEKLDDSARNSLYRQHVRFFCENTRRRIADAKVKRNLLLFWQDYANTEAAVDYAIAVGQADDAIDCASFVWHYLRVGLSLSFHRSLLERTLRRCALLSPAPRKTYLLWLGIGDIATLQGEFDLAREACEQARTLASEQQDQACWCAATNILGKIYGMSGDTDNAARCFESILNTCPDDEELSISVRNNLAIIALQCGDRERASELYCAAVQHARNLGSRLLGAMLANWAYLLLLDSHYEQAHQLLDEARQEANHRNARGVTGLTHIVEAFGAIRRKDLATARRLCGEGLKIFCESDEIPRQIETIGLLGQSMDPNHPDDIILGIKLISASRALQREYGIVPEAEDKRMASRAIDELRDTLDNVRFEEAWGEGSRMSLSQAIFISLPA